MNWNNGSNCGRRTVNGNNTLSNANWNIGWRVIPKSFLGALTSPLGENLSVLPGLRSIEGEKPEDKREDAEYEMVEAPVHKSIGDRDP